MLKRLYDAKSEDGGSSPNPDDNGQGSSPETQEQGAEQQPEDESTEDTSEGDGTESPDDAAGEEGGQPNPNKEKQELEEPALTDKEDDKKLDFHRHPRFQELIKEKNDVRAEVEALRPKADRADIIDNFLQSNGIQPQEFTRALEYLRLSRIDPAQAWNLIKPDVELLQQAVGERLPPDLEAKVAAGLDPDVARELARARVQTSRQNQAQAYNETYAAQQHEHLINSANAAWGQMKAQVDPSFRPKPTESHPDGVWELVNAKVLQLRSQNPPRSTQEAHRQCQAAYDAVTKSLSQFAPRKPVTKKPIGSHTSSTNSNPVIKSSDDVVKAIMSGKRPTDLRYS